VYRHLLNGWAVTYRTGAYFATRKYHDHYYSVAPAYVTENRPAFNAGGGYSGWANQLALSRRAGDWWYGLFVRHDNLRGTAFVDSPLVESREALSGGLALSWVLY
jgi:outer membrane scaffolding protein for murein synthesis (MipA/OmpV family)